MANKNPIKQITGIPGVSGTFDIQDNTLVGGNSISITTSSASGSSGERTVDIKELTGDPIYLGQLQSGVYIVDPSKLYYRNNGTFAFIDGYTNKVLLNTYRSTSTSGGTDVVYWNFMTIGTTETKPIIYYGYSYSNLQSGGTFAYYADSIAKKSDIIDVVANPTSTTSTLTALKIGTVNYALGTSVGVAYNMGTCTTSASTQAKTVNVGGTFSLTTGVSCIVYFTYANSNTSATLNVNSTGAKSIRLNGTTLSSTNKMLSAIYFCRYDGSYWQLYYMQGVTHPYHHHTFIQTYYVSGLTIAFNFDWWSNSPAPLTINGSNNNFISELKTAFENHRFMHSGYVVNSTKYFSIGYINFGADYDDDEGYWLDDYISIMYPSNTTGTTFTELKVTNDNTSVAWYGNDTVIN